MNPAKLELQLDEFEATGKIGPSLTARAITGIEIIHLRKYMDTNGYQVIESEEKLFGIPKRIIITPKDARAGIKWKDIEMAYDNYFKQS